MEKKQKGDYTPFFGSSLVNNMTASNLIAPTNVSKRRENRIFAGAAMSSRLIASIKRAIVNKSARIMMANFMVSCY